MVTVTTFHGYKLPEIVIRARRSSPLELTAETLIHQIQLLVSCTSFRKGSARTFAIRYEYINNGTFLHAAAHIH